MNEFEVGIYSDHRTCSCVLSTFLASPSTYLDPTRPLLALYIPHPQNVLQYIYSPEKKSEKVVNSLHFDEE